MVEEKKTCNCENEIENDCACNEHEEEMEVITLTFDDDTEVDCMVIGVFSVEEKEYIALLPDGEEDILLYKYAELDDEEIELSNIEDDDEFERASDVFYDLFEDDSEEDNEVEA